MKKITRLANVEVRALDNEEKRSVEGMAVVFDEETDLGFFFEKIDRHAFDNCDMSEVYCLLNHDENIILGGTHNGSLELNVEDRGLHQITNIIDTTQGIDTYKLAKSGLINKMSFGFMIDADGGEEWRIDENGMEHRTIKKISKLFDVSLVTYPAYPQTSVFARSVNDLDDLAKAHFEERKAMEEKIVEEAIEEVVEEVEAKEEPIAEVLEEKKEEVVAKTETTEEVAEEKIEEEKEERKMNTNFEVSKVEVVEDITAWRNAIMSGKEVRSGLKSTDTGVPVPTMFQSYVETAWEKVDILDEVSKSYVKGLFKVPYEVSADGAAYHAEGAAAPNEESLVLGVTTLIPRMIKKWISVTDELAALTDAEFMRYIADEVVYKVAKFLKDSILMGVGQGSGSNEGVVGISNAALTTAIAHALDFNVGNEALAEIDGGESPLMVVNRKTFFHNIMGLADASGRPIYNVAMDNEGKPSYFVNGIRVKFSDAIKSYDTATTGETWAIVGDFKAYKLNLPEGEEVQTLFDPYTLATEDKSRMIGRIFASGNVVRPMALAKLTKTA